jgi:DNA-binding NtrC family response regulator
MAERGQDASLCLEARAWQGWARTDLVRLGDAESILRALMVTAGEEPACAWGRVALARCLLAQGRGEEAGEVLPSIDVVERMPAWRASMARALAVRLALAEGNLFEAGRRAEDGLRAVEGCPDSPAAVVAHVAHLRVLCTVGELTLARVALTKVLELASRNHAPLRATRARLIWFEALRRAGHASDAAAQARRLSRVASRCPPLLRRSIVSTLNADIAPARATALGGAPAHLLAHTVELIRLVQREEEDSDAIRAVLSRITGWLNAGRAEVVSGDNGPVTPLVAVGGGTVTSCGARALECGIPVGFDERGREAAVPLWIGSQRLGALACRWPIDRSMPAQAQSLMELAGALLAPRVESLRNAARQRAEASVTAPALIGESVAMEEVRRAIARAARAPFSVLIEGESGTGKELVARAIHELGARRGRRFCDVNCAAMPDELFESELSGHSRGAFTGAVADRAGLFEEANGGTLFMDEVAELSARAQAKLLRVAQQQEVRRVGESFSRAVDVRLIAAANRDMRGEVAAGRFRQDLLYRLDVIRITVPPLRDRPGDIPALAQRFWESAAGRIGSKALLSPGVFAALARHVWPGNVRELQNVIAALAVAAPARGRVGASLLPADLGAAAGTTTFRLADARDDFDRRFVQSAIVRAGGSRTRAAAALGLSRQGLLKLIARLRIAEEAHGRGHDGPLTGRQSPAGE